MSLEPCFEARVLSVTEHGLASSAMHIMKRCTLPAACSLHRYSHSVVDVLPPEADSTIQMMQMALRNA